jgi:hypothetical protein
VGHTCVRTMPAVAARERLIEESIAVVSNRSFFLFSFFFF